MLEILCPTCQRPRRPGRLLPASSTGAQVEYYRCDSCGTVWTRDKEDPQAPQRIVLRPTSGTRAKAPPDPNSSD